MNVLIDAKYPNMKLKFLIDKVIRFEGEDGELPRFMAYEKRFHGATPEIIKYIHVYTLATWISS